MTLNMKLVESIKKTLTTKQVCDSCDKTLKIESVVWKETWEDDDGTYIYYYCKQCYEY